MNTAAFVFQFTIQASIVMQTGGRKVMDLSEQEFAALEARARKFAAGHFYDEVRDMDEDDASGELTLIEAYDIYGL